MVLFDIATQHRVQVVKNARDKYLRDFDCRVVVQKYIQLYKEVLN
ncbi:hypothetical protein [Thiomicrorhabdus hydrogeniphila]